MAKNTDPSPSTPQKKALMGIFVGVIVEILAVLLWIYFVTKLFIFDVDIFIANHFFPKFAWLINYKFFIIVGVVAIVWLFTKNKDILLSALYIMFYPFVILFFKIPRLIFKQKSWTIAFGLINAVMSFLRSLRFNFIMMAFFLTSVFLVFVSSNGEILWTSVLTLVCFLVIVYIHKLISVFRLSRIFQIYIRIFTGIREHGKSLFALDESIKDIPITQMDKQQLDKRTTNLQTCVLFNRVCLFVGKKLRDYQSSGLNVFSYIVTVLLLIILTIFIFAVINFGLFKINSSFYSISTPPTFFIFIYYSFNKLVAGSIVEMSPVQTISQIASMVEWLFSVLLLGIILAVFLQFKNQKWLDELNKVIELIERQGVEMESFIKDEFSIEGIGLALIELEKLKAGMVTFLYKISKSIEP